LLVNLTGCLLIGVLLAVLLSRFPSSTWVRPFLAVGVLGGYTTFSTFAVDLLRLGEAGAWLPAAGYLVASVVGGVACVVLGLGGARAVLHSEETALEDLAAGEDRT
jgi:CrcB protein